MSGPDLRLFSDDASQVGTDVLAFLTIAVLALAREVGVLRLRLAGESALDVAEEGPPLGSRVDLSARLQPATEWAPPAGAGKSSR